MKKFKNQAVLGFTIVELLIIITILGIIVSLAAPSLTNSLQGNAVRNTGNDLRAAISLARTTALGQRNNVDVTVCKAGGDATSCDRANADWTTGWVVWRDLNGDGSIDNGEREGIFVAANGARVTAGVGGDISFDGRGFATGINSFTIVSTNNNINCSVSILGTGIPRAGNC